MTKLARPAFALLIIGVFLVTHFARPASSDDRPIRLYANAGAGPIGSIDMWSKVSINGRRATGAQVIWGGEVIEAESDAHISIEDAGEVALTRGAIIKLARTRNSFDDEEGELLIAQIITGSASIRLNALAAAYVEAAGSTFIARRASRFKVDVNEGRVDLSVARGAVEEAQTTSQRRYQLRPIGLGANLSVRARATRQIQIQVTDENNNQAPDVPVLFTVNGQGGTVSAAGAAATATTSVTVRTDRRGIATVIFTAGANPASATLTATIPGTTAIFTTSVTVSAATAFLSTTTITLLAVGGAAAAGAAVVVAKKGNNNEDVVALPPVIRPK